MRRRPAPGLLREYPLRYFAFDVLAIGTTDLTGSPYRHRRQMLQDLAGASTSNVLVVPPFWDGIDPQQMLEVAKENGLEGIVSKRLESQYVSGRSRDWVKTPLRVSCELAVVGWLPSGGPARRDQIGALLLAGRDSEGRLILVGQVGSGFSSVERRRMYALLTKIPSTRAPVDPEVDLPGVRWVAPKYVGEVAFREYVPGRGLRHASWKGLREASDTIGMPPVSDF